MFAPQQEDGGKACLTLWCGVPGAEIAVVDGAEGGTALEKWLTVMTHKQTGVLRGSKTGKFTRYAVLVRVEWAEWLGRAV
jgi:hypothetical protein